MAVALPGDPPSYLTRMLDELLKEVEPAQRDVDTKHSCLKELAALSHMLGPNWILRPFGSAANGFCTRLSDLDVTCFEDSKQYPLTSAVEAMTRMLPLLQQHPSFEVNEVVPNARIPIMKIRYCSKLDVDLSFQNSEPLPNTQLLRAYAKVSPTIRQLGIVVKLWATAEDVCGAQDKHLSSYAIILLVLYFLQVDEYIQLPCFPTEHFTGQKSIPECAANVEWSCELSLASLISRFFEFYATMHCWGYEVVSPRIGKRLYTSDPHFAGLLGRKNATMIHVEDPILRSRNLNCVLGEMQQAQLYSKISQTHFELNTGQVPNGFMIALLTCHHKDPMHHAFATRCDLDAKSIARTGKPPKETKKPAIRNDGQDNMHMGIHGANLSSFKIAMMDQRHRAEPLIMNTSLHDQILKHKISTLEQPPPVPAVPIKLGESQPYLGIAGPSPEAIPTTRLCKDEIEDGMTWKL